ncbi:polysaccharide biosynthesis tyrosine autokinase [Vibrio sp. 05-20-BW147]|uniref:GumC family protein n=1 Tax=Vibrio sp. 05-20-BW147 TaxID=2575834 RepID=UPI001593200F|nr:polysaccharide biosynthesis tyrosine autokinase [Vibrio sp. 05-20-BW147]NVC63213.1 polysaccharide biosynthesis tyrosine autokinase [Vibrio sp. 05-20-BW147]
MDHPLSQPRPAEQIVDLRQIWHGLMSFKWRILGFTFMATLLAILVVLNIAPQYTARATLMIEASQARAVSIEEVYGIDTKSQEYFLTQFEILKSDRIAERVIERLALVDHPEFNPEEDEAGFSPASVKAWLQQTFPLLEALKAPTVPLSSEEQVYRARQKVLSAFKANLSISPVRKTQLVHIFYTSKDPKLAALIANEVGKVFIEENIEAKLQVAQEANSWLNVRMEELREKMRASEANLQQFLQSEGLVDVQGVSGLASKELAELSTQLNKARDRRVAAETLFNITQNQSKKGPDVSVIASIPEISSHPTIQDVKLAEVQAERKVSELSKRYGPKHPKLKAATAELESVKRNLNNEIRQLVKGINSELQAARQSERTLQAEMDKRKVEFQTLSIQNAKFSELQREVQTNRDLFDLFLNRQKETSASSDFNATVARFTDFAKPPLQPSKPNRKLVVLLAFVASFGLGCVLALVADSLKDTFRDVKQIDRELSLALLGTVPKLKLRKPLRANDYFDAKHRQLKESVRSIRTAYLLANTNKPSKVVMLTSAIPEEGKTTASINFALSMAQMERTLLIDADLRKPSLGSRFGLNSAQPGLTNVLTGTHPLEECLYHDEALSLDVLSAGVLTSNPLELISSSAFVTLLDELKERYDRIVIDSPPCLPVSDSYVLAQQADSTIIVINSDRTRVSEVKEVVMRFAQQGTRMDGVILNKLDTKQASRYGHYGNYQGYYGIGQA